MRILILVIVAAFFVSCGVSATKRCQTSKDERLANQISKEVAVKLNEEWGLVPFGTAGQMMDEIKMLGLSFCYLKPLNLDEAREMLIDAVNQFTSAINANDQIRPYLNKYPFEHDNVLIEIYIFQPGYKEVEPGKLTAIFASEGVLEYKIRGQVMDTSVTYHKESYDEAVQELKSK